MPNGNGTVTYKAIVMLLAGALLAIVGILYNSMAVDIKQLQIGQIDLQTGQYEIRLLIAKEGNVSQQVPMTKTLDDILIGIQGLQSKSIQPKLGIQK